MTKYIQMESLINLLEENKRELQYIKADRWYNPQTMTEEKVNEAESAAKVIDDLLGILRSNNTYESTEILIWSDRLALEYFDTDLPPGQQQPNRFADVEIVNENE